MIIIEKYTLLLPGNGWDTTSDKFSTTYDIHFNMRDGLTQVIINKYDKISCAHIETCYTYDSPVRFVYDFCKLCRMDIRDYTDITELEPGVECLLYCYLITLYERMIDLAIDDKCEHND